MLSLAAHPGKQIEASKNLLFFGWMRPGKFKVPCRVQQLEGEKEEQWRQLWHGVACRPAAIAKRHEANFPGARQPRNGHESVYSDRQARAVGRLVAVCERSL